MTEHQQESQLITRSNNDLSQESLGALPSLSSRAMFWRPKFLCSSDWLDHLPFAFWLIDSIQPKVVVELGVGSGASYFAFCQAMDKLNVDGRCYAVDNWSRTERQPQLATVQQYHQTQYEEFSKILDHDFFQAPALFLDGSIDLLHLNLPDSTLDLTLLFQLWQPKLSADAVVLLHHSQSTSISSVAALKAQLIKQHRHFEFLQQHGLLVVQQNKLPSDSFRRLMEIRPGEKTYEIVQHVFSRLGKACSETMNAELARLDVQQVNLVLADAKTEIQQRQQKIDGLLTELHEHKTWLSSRNQELGQLNEQLSKTQQQRIAEQTALNQRISLLESLKTELKLELDKLFGHVELLTDEKRQLQTQLQQQTQQAEQAAQAQHQQLQLVSAELQQTRQQNQQAVAELQQQLQQQVIAAKAAASEAAQQQQQAVAELQRQLQQQAEETAGAVQQAETKHQQAVTALQQQLQAAQTASQQLEASKQQEITALQQQLQAAQTASQQLEARKQQEITALQQQLQAAQTGAQQQILDLQTDRQQLERQLQVQADELARHQQELAVFTRQSEQQRQQAFEQNRQLEQKLQEAQSQTQHHEQQQQRAFEQNRQLEQKLQEAQRQSQHHEQQQQQAFELTRQLEQKLQEADSQSQHRFIELATLTQLLEQSQQESAKVSQQLAAVSAEADKVVSLQQQLAAVSAEADKVVPLQQQLAAVSAEAGKVVPLQQQLAAKQTELTQCYTELATLGQLVQQQQAMSATAQAQLQAQLNKTKKQQQQIQRTASWKLTAPLRAVSSIFGSKPDKDAQLKSEVKLIEQSGLFDENWYLSQYPDLAKAEINPLWHYLKFGGFEGRKPNPDFDSAFYLAQYQDVVAAGLNPLVHYVRFGRDEQRLTSTQNAEVS